MTGHAGSYRNSVLGQSRPLRVLFYNHCGDISGAEISLLLTIQHLKAIDAILAAPEGELLNQARENGIKTLTVRSSRARMSRNPFRILWGTLGTVVTGFRLRQVITQCDPDIVHANSIRAGLIGVVATYRRNTPLLWHIRDRLSCNIVGRFIRKLAERHVTHLFAISKAMAENFSTTPLLRSKTTLVYNGIATQILPAPMRVRAEVGTAPECFVVGVVGQIALWKRQIDALKVFSNFHRKIAQSELWIVGSPKFRKENTAYYHTLQDLARKAGLEKSVRFLGYRKDILDVMESIDVLLVPSENEPFGRVVIEAMLAGKPVIGTNGGGIPEIILHGETGFVVDTGDLQRMTALLRRISHSKDLRRLMGENARRHCLDQFSIERTCSQIQQIYDFMFQNKERKVWSVEAQTRLSGQ